MKLIAEYTDHKIEVITERTERGGKNHFIEGIFMQSEQRNRNGRIYPKTVMEKAVDRYVTEQVKTGRAVGELNHPDGPSINLDKVSHLIETLDWQGNDVVGKARILETPMGQIVKGLLDGGVRLGVSTRGMGSIEERNGVAFVKDDFILSTVDIVQDPSAPTAFVNGIMEGVEWVWNNGIIQPQVIEKMETEIKKAPRSALYETQVREFKNFLSLLKTKNIGV
jgi:hypothetical protein